MINDLPQHSLVKQCMIFYANSRVDLLDQTCQCPMHQLGLDPEQLRRKYKNQHLPSHDLHLGMSCFKIQQTSSGFQLPLQICVQNQEVTRLQPRKVSHTERFNLIWSHTVQHKVKMNIIHCNPAICRQSNLIASNVRQ